LGHHPLQLSSDSSSCKNFLLGLGRFLDLCKKIAIRAMMKCKKIRKKSNDEMQKQCNAVLYE
jgi:hypothetical protein